MLVFVRSDVHAKSNRCREVHRLGAPCFLYMEMHMLKVIEVEGYADWEPVAFVHALVHCHACLHLFAPCAGPVEPVIGLSTTECWYA
jgi:hypothetical protein